MQPLMLASVLVLAAMSAEAKLYAPPRVDAWIKMEGPVKRTPEITFLVWSMIWGVSPPSVIETDVGTCRVTTDHSAVSKAAVVWFHWPNASPPPIPRPKGALWVYFSMESQGYAGNRNDHEKRHIKHK